MATRYFFIKKRREREKSYCILRLWARWQAEGSASIYLIYTLSKREITKESADELSRKYPVLTTRATPPEAEVAI